MANLIVNSGIAVIVTDDPLPGHVTVNNGILVYVKVPLIRSDVASMIPSHVPAHLAGNVIPLSAVTR